jgi:hypothetical protein
MISILIRDNVYNYYFLGFTAIFQFAELSVFIYFRAKEITEFLEIRVFCVKSSDEVKI